MKFFPAARVRASLVGRAAALMLAAAVLAAPAVASTAAAETASASRPALRTMDPASAQASTRYQTMSKTTADGVQTCKDITTTVTYKTSTGAKGFTYFLTSEWCYDKIKVATVSHTTGMTDSNGTFKIRTNKLDTQYWMDAAQSSAKVEVQGHVQACPPNVGCMANYYPYIAHTLSATGYYYYEWRK